MSEFERICSRADLPKEGEAKEFALASGRPLCIARISGEVTAMDNECPHNGGPLAEGMIEGSRVICPWHAWAFDVHTGEAEHNPAAKVEVFETKVDGDDVLVKV
jgi:nitrite reductase (NADH) small subunit